MLPYIKASCEVKNNPLTLRELSEEAIYDRHFLDAIKILYHLELDQKKYCNTRVYFFHKKITEGQVECVSIPFGEISYLRAEDGKISPLTFFKLHRITVENLAKAGLKLATSKYSKFCLNREGEDYFVDRFSYFEVESGFFRDWPIPEAPGAFSRFQRILYTNRFIDTILHCTANAKRFNDGELDVRFGEHEAWQNLALHSRRMSDNPRAAEIIRSSYSLLLWHGEH